MESLVRFLLLIVLAVAAVATPASAAPGDLLAEDSLPVDATEASSSDATVSFVDQQAAVSCRFVNYELPTSDDPLDVQADPDGCWREFLERNLPPWIGWPFASTETQDASSSASTQAEPSESSEPA